MTTPNGRLGVVVIGAGSAGRQHREAIGLSSGCDLVGFVDAAPSAVLDGVRRYADLSAALHDDTVDVVAFCTPPWRRTTDALQCVAAGRSVLLEKPPVTDIDDLHRIVEAGERAHVATGVMLQHRFAIPASARDLPAEPAATATLEVSRPRHPDRFRTRDWRSDPAQALGGITAHLGVHYLDAACCLLGEPTAIRVSVLERAGPGIDLKVAGEVTFEQGRSLVFTVTALSGERRERLGVLSKSWSATLEDGTWMGDSGIHKYAARPAATLRALVYDDMATAHLAGGPPAVADLRRAAAVMSILTQIRKEAST